METYILKLKCQNCGKTFGYITNNQKFLYDDKNTTIDQIKHKS